MKILVNCKLKDKQIETHIIPLSMVKSIDKIDIIRERAGPSIKKVKYHTSLLFRIPIFGKFFQLLSSISLGFKLSPDHVIGFYLVPHGIISIITSKLINSPCIVCMIGSDINVHLNSSFKKFYFWFLNKANLVTVPGKNSMNKLIPHLDPNKIKILPHGIDTRKFFPKDIKKIYDLIYVGDLKKNKQVDKIIRSVAGTGLNLAIVGDGPERKDLEKLANDLELNEKIKFLGFRNDVNKLFQKSKFLVMASKNEGLPLVIIEAMSCGVVPIVPDVGDISSIIKNNYNGILLNHHGNINFNDIIPRYEQIKTNILKGGEIKSFDHVNVFWNGII